MSVKLNFKISDKALVGVLKQHNNGTNRPQGKNGLSQLLYNSSFKDIR